MDKEQEAALSFTLIDFNALVKSVGANAVLSAMDEETFWALYKWFSDNYQFDLARNYVAAG